MKSLPTFVGITTLIAFAALAKGADSPGQPPKTGLLADGFFKQVSDPIGKMLPFTFDGPRLALDRKAWGVPPKEEPVPGLVPGVRIRRLGMGGGHPIEAFFHQIQTASGTNGNSMGISGDDREQHFSGGKINGRLHTRGNIVRGLVLEETSEPNRVLNFGEDDKAGFHLQVTHPDGDMILLSQAPKGAFRLVAFVGGRTIAGQGENFTACYRQHRATMEADVLPVLLSLGIQPILSPLDPKVRKAVTAQLLRSPATVEEGRKLIAELDHDVFATRDKASKQLTDRYALYQDLVRGKLKDTTASLEVKTRLEKVVAAHVDSTRVNQVIELLDLTRDPGYLASLLEGAAPEETAVIVKGLETTTGQKLGSQPGAWKEWLAKNVKTPPR